MIVHGMSIGEICFTAGMSEGLVRQHMDLAEELGLSEKDFPQSRSRTRPCIRASNS